MKPSPTSSAAREKLSADTTETSLLPAGGLPCLWMSAGLLAWRLCDREYDCDHCPLDSALAGGAQSIPSSPVEVNATRRLEFPDDRLYASSHGWLERLENGQVRLGLDMLVIRLLDQVSAVVLPAAGSRVRRGQPLCWLVDAGIPVPITCPSSGIVQRVNASVREDPALLASSAYERGWLVELSTRGSPIEGRADLADAQEQRAIAARKLRALRKQAARRRPPRGRRRVGPTLCDGGVRLRGLRRLLGTPAYHAVVGRLLV